MVNHYMIHTPADALPEAEPPKALGEIAKLTERIERIENELGIRVRREHIPLPGSTVEPLDDKAE